MLSYLALGDSVSIDSYTGVPGGGAASQFARLIGADEVQDLAYDGCTTAGVLDTLELVSLRPDVVTLTAGGNDLLIGAVRELPGNLEKIAGRLAAFECPVILNTIYDPTDGDDRLLDELGLPPAMRPVYERINDGIRTLARRHGFLLADLQALFHGHGIASPDNWIILRIEPNLAGATAIAREWFRLFQHAHTTN
ncbi:MAG: SGNH/GDSL hydrolase family protein [Armatimonadota bacterium]